MSLIFLSFALNLFFSLSRSLDAIVYDSESHPQPTIHLMCACVSSCLVYFRLSPSHATHFCSEIWHTISPLAMASERTKEHTPHREKPKQNETSYLNSRRKTWGNVCVCVYMCTIRYVNRILVSMLKRTRALCPAIQSAISNLHRHLYNIIAAICVIMPYLRFTVLSTGSIHIYAVVDVGRGVKLCHGGCCCCCCCLLKWVSRSR